MKKIHEWEIRGKVSEDEALKTIFHPTLYRFYLKGRVRSLKNLRIELIVGEPWSRINFYEKE